MVRNGFLENRGMLSLSGEKMNINEQIEIANFQKFLSYKMEKMMRELYKEFSELPKSATSNAIEPPWESSWTCPLCKTRNTDIAERDSIIRKCGSCSEIIRIS